MAVVEEQGGAVEAVPYMKARLVESHRERIARIERGEIRVVGQNSFTESEDSPLTAGADGGILTPDPEVERECREALERWQAERDADAVEKALAELRAAAADERQNIMPATIAAATARSPPASGRRPCATRSATTVGRPASAHRHRAHPRSSWPRSGRG